MKRAAGLVVLTFALQASLPVNGAEAVSKEISTQQLLIEKLTQVQLNLAPNDPARVSVVLRLADLHAERARLLSMKELNENCTVCTAGEKDRQKALQFYSEGLQKAPAAAKAKVQLQVGHLQELLGKTSDARLSYEKILNLAASSLELADAHFALAEMDFRASEFSKADAHFYKVLQIEGATLKGLAAYRKAWCAFRMNQLPSAIDQLQVILQDPKLQSRTAASRTVADPQFLEEVSRDLATFMAARGIADSDPQKLYDLTPPDFKLAQVTLLAREGVRLGQKESAVKAWDFVYQRHSDPRIRLEALAQKSRLSFDLKRLDSAAGYYNQALALWSTAGCTMESCGETHGTLRQFVIGWNRLETVQISTELLKAYSDYLGTFPEDADMLVWAAQAAVQAGDGARAFEWRSQASQVLAAVFQKESDSTAKKTVAEKLEKNLLLNIEEVEKAKDDSLLAKAQQDYLKLSPTQEKAKEVDYQIAYAIYKKGDYVNASLQMRALAMDAKVSSLIRRQAADLSLDALALLKDDAKIQLWSQEYAGLFPDQKAEFSSLAQKSILNQSALWAQSDGPRALAALKDFDSSRASVDDQKVFLKNKLILQEKLRKITEARNTADEFLKLPNLTLDEKEFALGRKAWLAELQLDFATALKTSEQMRFTELSADSRILKLALYAELAGQDPKNHYLQFLKQSKDLEKKALIALRLVRSSAKPGAELDIQKSILQKSPGLYGQAVIEVYSTTKDRAVLEKALKGKVGKEDGLVMAERLLLVDDIQAMSRQLVAHHIDGKNPKLLGATLKERVKLLEKAENLANRAIANASWASQLLALHMIAVENQRFYDEVLSLPVPADLNEQQQQEYLQMLGQQVSPNQNKARLATEKLKEFWEQKTVAENYKVSFAQFPGLGDYWVREVNLILAIAPVESKPAFQDLLQLAQSEAPTAARPSFAELEKARLKLKENPFATEAIQEVLTMEKKAQRPVMAEYFETRLAALSAEVPPQSAPVVEPKKEKQ